MRGKILAAAMVLAGVLAGQLAARAADGHIASVELGTDRTEKYQVINPTTEFGPETQKIVCVWKTDGAKVGVPVRGVWIAENVGSFRDFKISESTLNDPGANEGSFAAARPPQGWPPGTYRVEVYRGSELGKSLRFTIRPK